MTWILCDLALNVAVGEHVWHGLFHESGTINFSQEHETKLTINVAHVLLQRVGFFLAGLCKEISVDF